MLPRKREMCKDLMAAIPESQDLNSSKEYTQDNSRQARRETIFKGLGVELRNSGNGALIWSWW